MPDSISGRKESIGTNKAACLVVIASKIKLRTLYISYISCIFVEKNAIMETTIKPTKRKVIDIPEDIFRYLSIKAAASGTNLKNYIENLLAKEVEEMDDSETYAYLSKTRPEGHVMVSDEEKQKFEEWLGVKGK